MAEEKKVDFDPRNLTEEEMTKMGKDLRTYVFKNWDNGEIGGVTKFFLRGMIQDAMKARKGGGGVPKKKLKSTFGVPTFDPPDFTPAEQDSIEVGLKDHLKKEWDNFTFITQGQIADMAKIAKGKEKEATQKP